MRPIQSRVVRHADDKIFLRPRSMVTHPTLVAQPRSFAAIFTASNTALPMPLPRNSGFHVQLFEMPK